jgi:hypothetical protein
MQLPEQTESKSLIKTINRIGPNTDPCGTPLKTLENEEKQLLITTHCCLLYKKFRIQARRDPDTP